MSPYVGSVEQRKKPQPTLCECDALASLRHSYLGSFFLDPGDIKSPILGGRLEL